MRVFIGFDPREAAAYLACRDSLRRVTNRQIEPEPLDVVDLRRRGLLTRLVDHRDGQDYDLISNRHTATRFNISRFLVPILCQQGPALFVDCDTIFYRDPRDMLSKHIKREGWALRCVKHEHVPSSDTKMVGQRQRPYDRKNWSSVMLFDCSHPANDRLSLWDVNNRDREDLHGLYWLNEDVEIGALDPAWNWLVNEQPRPDNLGIAHFTNGGPWLPGWEGAPNDDLWLEAAHQWRHE